MTATRVSTTPCLTDEQLRWYQFDPDFNWLDLSRGGEFLSPDARRPITLYDEGLDAFETVFYGSPLVQSSWAPRTRSTYQGWVCVYCRFCALRGRPPPPSTAGPFPRVARRTFREAFGPHHHRGYHRHSRLVST